MSRILLRCLAVTAVLAFLLSGGSVDVSGKASLPEKEQTADPVREMKPLLAKYCVGCHGENKPRAGLNLASLIGQTGTPDPARWKKVWERIKSRQMPPLDRPQPAAQERDSILARIEDVFAKHTLDGHPDPGPLRPRRLNVREYMNTLRDLVLYKGASDPRIRDPKNPPFATKKDGTVSTYRILPPPEHLCGFVLQVLPQDTTDGGFDTVGDNLSIP